MERSLSETEGKLRQRYWSESGHADKLAALWSEMMAARLKAAQEAGATFVAVRRNPSSRQIAQYRTDDLQTLHWSRPTTVGGTTPSPPTLSGYVDCDLMVSGELEHSCESWTPPPHSVKVCVIERDNSASVCAELAAQAGPKPRT